MKVNETDEDRRNWMIVAILSIPLILIFLTFGEPYYESLDIVGKRAFMLAFQIVFLTTIGGFVSHWLQRRYKVEDRK
ncbi:MAG: hypothetical protein ACW99U_16185 [Candidatus Thorarchaeota archaeon]